MLAKLPPLLAGVCGCRECCTIVACILNSARGVCICTLQALLSFAPSAERQLQSQLLVLFLWRTCRPRALSGRSCVHSGIGQL